MVTVYCPEELPLLDGLGNAHMHCPRVRAATKSVLVHAVMSHLTGLLEKDAMLGKTESTVSHLCGIAAGRTVIITGHHYASIRFFQER